MNAIQKHDFLLIVLVSLLITAITALCVVYAAFSNRQLFIELQQLEANARSEQVEIGKLLLEESAWSSPAVVEKLARQQLLMQEPDYDYIVYAPGNSAPLLANSAVEASR